MNSFRISYYISVLIQFISFCVQFYGYTLHVHSKLLPLKYSLNIEFFVSIIEFIVYIWIGFNLTNLTSVMNKRYLDWVITTNALMISMAILMNYYAIENNNPNLKTVVYDNIPKYIPILLFNNLMLAIGFLGEKKIIQKYISFSGGLIFFILSFFFLYIYFAQHSLFGRIFFYSIAFIWLLYGIAHLMNDKTKNIMYNVLDLFSKNFFGIMIVFIILRSNS